MKKRIQCNIICIISLIFILFLMNHIVNSKEEKIELYPSKVKSVRGHCAMEDPEGGGPIIIKDIKASNYIKDNTGIDYSINNVLGGTWDTAWCVNGNGIGEWIKVVIPINLRERKGITNLYRILVVNGLGKNKELYFANNRVKRIEVETSGGEKVFLNLHDDDLELQRFKINIKAEWLKMTIKEIYKSNKYNDTCIGKIFFETE
ncbi:MAG: hypothetical protein V1874_04765 [Spirochaetota bacterium]